MSIHLGLGSWIHNWLSAQTKVMSSPVRRCSYSDIPKLVSFRWSSFSFSHSGQSTMYCTRCQGSGSIGNFIITCDVGSLTSSVVHKNRVGAYCLATPKNKTSVVTSYRQRSQIVLQMIYSIYINE